MPIRIEQWSVTLCGGPYTPPELLEVALHGSVYGHPNVEDGTGVITTPIRKAEGQLITTRSGSVYLLGEISPGYLEYVKKIRPNWDPENPITMIGEEELNAST